MLAYLLFVFSLVCENLMQVFGLLLELTKRTLGVSSVIFSAFEVAAPVPLVGFPLLGESYRRCLKRSALTFALLPELR